MAVKSEKPNKKENTPKKDIVIEETEDDIVLTKDFKNDLDDLTEEIRRESGVNGAFMNFILPLLVFLGIACLSGVATYYYAKPERSIESNIRAEDKMQTPPTLSGGAVDPNPPASSPVTTTTTRPVQNAISYTVQEGDTMSGIANKYDMTSAELAKFNGITDVNSLQIGQVIKIPGK